MKKLITILFVLALSTLTALAQEKGVDKQSQVIRDTGNNRAPASNGTKTDVGTSGSGINFGKDRTPNAPPIPNPFRFSARRDLLIQAVEDLMRDRKLIPDTAASKPDEGIVISQPFTFTKGAVVSQGELSRYAQISDANARGWTRGRYTIVVEVQPIDGVNTNVSINAKIEGKTGGASGPEWTTLKSTGALEEEFLNALIEKITGAPFPGHPSSIQQ